jgi:hypothetical protein
MVAGQMMRRLQREALERVSWAKVLDGMTVNERLHELNLAEEFDAARAAMDVAKIEEILVRARVDRISIKAIVEAL